MSEEALGKAKAMFVGAPPSDAQMTPVGFSTAGGKKVTVSEQALGKAKAMFGGASSPEAPVTPVGFSTAGGRQVTVSEQALGKARAVMEEAGVKEVTMAEGASNRAVLEGSKGASTAVGFSTGRGQPVEVSAAALARAQAVLGGAGDPGGQEVSVSEEALRRAKERMEGSPGINMSPGGFSTARGQEVSVSDEALRKAKQKMGSGFSTARGEEVRVSEEALRKAQLSMGAPRVTVEEVAATEADWGEEDEAEFASLAAVAEVTKGFRPYRCRPHELTPRAEPYRCRPDTPAGGEEAAATAFTTPYTGGKRRQEEEGVDYGAVLGKRARSEEVEAEVVVEEDVGQRREELRRRQDRLIESKRSKTIRAMPGRLLAKRSSQARMAPHSMVVRAELCRPAVAAVTADTAAAWRFQAAEHYSREAVEGGQVALGDGGWLVLGEEGEVGVEEVRRAFLCLPGVDPRLVVDGWVENHYR